MCSLLITLATLLTICSLLTPATTAKYNIRLSTYCSTHNNCPPNSDCDLDVNYCQCFSGYSPPDRKLDSCQPTTVFPKLYDGRFSFLEAVCKSRLNCPPNSYCDPVGQCTCYPGWVTLDKVRCVFEEWGTVPEDDLRWRQTGTPCRSTTNCMTDSECTASFCMCREGYAATDTIGDGYYSACRVGGATALQVTSSSAILAALGCVLATMQMQF